MVVCTCGYKDTSHEATCTVILSHDDVSVIQMSLDAEKTFALELCAGAFRSDNSELHSELVHYAQCILPTLSNIRCFGDEEEGVSATMTLRQLLAALSAVSRLNASAATSAVGFISSKSFIEKAFECGRALEATLRVKATECAAANSSMSGATGIVVVVSENEGEDKEKEEDIDIEIEDAREEEKRCIDVSNMPEIGSVDVSNALDRLRVLARNYGVATPPG